MDDEAVNQKLATTKVLMVGAGGIGCELLKNLVLSGFGHIDVVDLDTIDVSNLNRQFLFQREHVGKSKAQTAVESVQFFNDKSKIKHYHCSIQDPSFDVNFFKQYDLVLNALDNRAARNHVNRLCLAADVPLIESGSAGYSGQVGLIKKGMTECYECQPKAVQRTFPGCTIRNTPSEPIHCIVWAKHLFNQLFGAADSDQDVSPDMSDPELQNKGSAAEHPATNGGGSPAANSIPNDKSAEEETGNVQRISTRQWAVDNGYDPQLLFTKFFDEDIAYLLLMKNLWKKRTPPEPLQWNNVTDDNGASGDSFQTMDQGTWSISKYRKVFSECVEVLKSQASATGEDLVWDKDDETCLNFVTACANLRAHCFHIQKKSRFDIKAMAGNIIPAIATTNAIIGGLIVIEAIKLLSDRANECVASYVAKYSGSKSMLLRPEALSKPNPACYVCSSKSEVTVKLNCTTFTVRSLAEKVLKQSLNMVAPDVEVDDNSGRVIVSSDEEETSDLLDKTLSELNLQDGTRLRCDDFQQQFELRLILLHSTDLPQDTEFEILTDTTGLKAKPETAAAASDDDVEDLTIVENDFELIEDDSIAGKKRKAKEMINVDGSDVIAKKAKSS